MAQRTGTHTFADLLSNRFQTVAEFGLENIQPILQAELDGHNAVMEQIVGEIAEVSDDIERIYGSAVGGTMQLADEFAVTPTQKASPGAEVAFPLRKYEFPIGWTREFFLRSTPADMAVAMQNAEIAHRKAVVADARSALFRATNYTFTDKLGRVQKDLTIKAFLNADGDPIPAGPNGEEFDGSSETHFSAVASLSTAALTAAIDDVALKASDASMVKVAISKTNEAAFKALSGFESAIDQRLLPTEGDPREQLDIRSPLNRLIGYFAGAEIWVKPWAAAGYALVYDAGASEKPLVMRVDPSPSLRGLVIAAEIPDHPLYARVMEARFGFGVYNRRAGAALEFGSDTSYTNPGFVTP